MTSERATRVVVACLGIVIAIVGVASIASIGGWSGVLYVVLGGAILGLALARVPLRRSRR